MEKGLLNIDNCLKCTYCNTVCPVLKVFPEYPGPKKLGSDIERFRREGLNFSEEWVDYCLGCGQCSLICPNQVGVSEYITEAKARQAKKGSKKVRDYVFARPALLGKISVTASPVSNLMFKVVQPIISIGGVTPSRKLPIYTKKLLTKTVEVELNNNQLEGILLFPGCFINYNNPGLGKLTISVLEKVGYKVEIAQTGCCGLPARADKKEALADARKNILAMEEFVTRGYKVVTPCTSCSHTLKSWYAELFMEDDRLSKIANLIATSTYDLGELLETLLEEGKLIQPKNISSRKLAYHMPCHLKTQGIGKPWFNILKEIPQLEVFDVDNGCCGMSGTYGFKQEKYNISMEIGEQLFNAINNNQPNQVITECASCRMQIEHGTKYKALHPVEVFAEILSLSEEIRKKTVDEKVDYFTYNL